MARNYRVKNGISFGTGVSDLSGLNCEYYQTSLGTTTLTLVGLCSTSVIRSAKYLIQLTQPSNNQVAEAVPIPTFPSLLIVSLVVSKVVLLVDEVIKAKSPPVDHPFLIPQTRLLTPLLSNPHPIIDSPATVTLLENVAAPVEAILKLLLDP